MAIPEFLQQLLTMGPAIGAGVSGNGEAMSAFMESYQRTMEQLQQQKRQGQQDAFAQEDRQFQRSRIESQDQRLAEQDRIAGEDRQRRRAVEGLEIPGVLAQQGAAMESPEQAKALIESLMPTLMQGFGQEAMAFGQPAVEMAQQVITGRQKKAVEAFVEQALKTSYVSDNPDADPELTELPEHIQKIVGKPSARLSELQRYAALPVGKPAKPQERPAPFTLSPGATRYDGQGKPIATAPERPPRPSQTDPEIADLRKDLLRLQVERAGEPKEPNQTQFTSAGFAGRMEQAEPILTKVTGSIAGMSLPSFELQTNSWFAKPTFQSSEVQSYMQSARNFINAVLRRESGAVISPEEFKEARQQYLPVAGDDENALAQKAANRQYVRDTMKRSAGSAYEPPIAPVASHGAASAQGRAAAVNGERRKFGDELRQWNAKTQRWVKVNLAAPQ